LFFSYDPFSHTGIIRYRNNNHIKDDHYLKTRRPFMNMKRHLMTMLESVFTIIFTVSTILGLFIAGDYFFSR